LDGNETPAAILAGPQITLFLFIADSANNIEIYLETVLFAAVGTKFRSHI
jgi:hypothetical protein